MAGVVKAMDAAMKSMNLEKISGLMDKFENQFEDLDVQSSYMDNTMSQTVTTSVPQQDVDHLMQQVADEAGYVNLLNVTVNLLRYEYTHSQLTIVCDSSLELNMELPTGPQSIASSTQVSQEQDELTQRLARLRQVE